MIPNIFYITEKAWNYFPYTVTEYTVSIRLKYELDGLGLLVWVLPEENWNYVTIRTVSSDKDHRIFLVFCYLLLVS